MQITTSHSRKGESVVEQEFECGIGEPNHDWGLALSPFHWLPWAFWAGNIGRVLALNLRVAWPEKGAG
eukprot:10954694-Alexandrium_andersonii.AAC.1